MNSKKSIIASFVGVAMALVLLGAIALGLNSNQPVVEAQTSAATPAPKPANANAPALPRTITVVGEGKVVIEPDIAQTNIGVEIVADNVKAASAEASKTLEAVMAALKKLGLPAEDVQTAGYNIWVERPYGPEGPTGDSLYHVSNSLQVTIRDLDKVGATLDAAIEAGANNIYGVTFSLANQGQAAAKARRVAVANGLGKAKQLAQLNKVELGDIISVSEVVGNGGGYYASNFNNLPSFAEGLGGGGPITPGQLELSVQLEITYAIQ